MHIPRRDVHVLKRIVRLTRCLVLSLLLWTFTVGAAWGQDTAGIVTKTEDAAMVVPRGLVQRIGHLFLIEWVDDDGASHLIRGAREPR